MLEPILFHRNSMTFEYAKELMGGRAERETRQIFYSECYLSLGSLRVSTSRQRTYKRENWHHHSTMSRATFELFHLAKDSWRSNLYGDLVITVVIRRGPFLLVVVEELGKGLISAGFINFLFEVEVIETFAKGFAFITSVCIGLFKFLLEVTEAVVSSFRAKFHIFENYLGPFQHSQGVNLLLPTIR